MADHWNKHIRLRFLNFDSLSGTSTSRLTYQLTDVLCYFKHIFNQNQWLIPPRFCFFYIVIYRQHCCSCGRIPLHATLFIHARRGMHILYNNQERRWKDENAIQLARNKTTQCKNLPSYTRPNDVYNIIKDVSQSNVIVERCRIIAIKNCKSIFV